MGGKEREHGRDHHQSDLGWPHWADCVWFFWLSKPSAVIALVAPVAFADGDALLYFSMGPGCDGCFHQIPEIAADLADDGITLIPVMVDPAPRVSAEADRFGITMPILIDADRSLSRSYNMIGIYGHQDRPSHSFALVNQDREIAWVKHYAEMFVPLEQLLADMRESI